MSTEFKIGDAVWCKLTKQKMIVISCNDDDIICQYKEKGKYKTESFTKETLSVTNLCTMKDITNRW